MRLPCGFSLAGSGKSRFDGSVKADDMAEMKCRMLGCFCITAFAFAEICVGTNAADTNGLAAPQPAPQAELSEIPDIRLEAQPPLAKEEEAQILNLIRNLANIEDPDFGFSPTMSGESFAPVQTARQAGVLLLTDHHLRTSVDLVELVKLGPKALPFLLKALDDQTPTKLVITHDWLDGGMWFQTEDGSPKETIHSYTVKVGDVCFVIIGQIVGAWYQAVGYVPSHNIIINSPTHDANLARQVRKTWSNINPDQHLLDSLLFDFSTRGGNHIKSLEGWYVGLDVQSSSAMRLMYYFPQQTTNLIATCLRRLDVGKTHGVYVDQRGVAHASRSKDFIEAVAWSSEPAIQAELRRICEVTSDPDLVSATGVAMDKATASAFRRRLEESIASLPETEKYLWGEDSKLLLALGRQFGSDAKPAFERFMQNASLERRFTMCWVLTEVRGDLSVDLLGPLLEDARPAFEGWTYAVVSERDQPRLPMRICDKAAETIAKNFPKLKFTMVGQYADLDRQIQKMRDQISHHEY
ncbi:MAG: hypothetical protein ABSA47_03580 [Verrucomicrobiota bacterium]|jgi:hypothetical protein